MSGDVPVENPFSTRFVRPGAIPFRFPPGDSAAALADRFLTLGPKAQILGPHGSGKSTLLAALAHEFRARGDDLREFSLRDRQRALPIPPTAAPWTEQTIVVIDGYEQLGWWSRGRLQRRLASSAARLLVTTHRDLRWPTLWRTAVNAELAAEIVAGLVADESLSSPDRLAESLARHAGNFREVLFECYDRFERHR